MPDFEFQPWEKISPNVTDGEAHVCAVINARDWMWRLCGDFWFGRQCILSGSEWNYLFRPAVAVSSSGNWAYLDRHCPLEEWLSDLEQEDSCDSGFGLARLWQWKEQSVAQTARVVWSNTSGWMFLPSPFEQADVDELVPFHLKDGADIEELPSSILYLRLQQEWQNPESDLRFSARFAEDTREEQTLWSIQTQICTSHTFAGVLRSALRAFCLQWPDELETASLHFSARNFRGDFEWMESATPFPFGIRERAILRRIAQTFEPRRMVDFPTLPSAIRVCINRGMDYFSISVSRPTTHEQLEAMLELRQWLEEYWPEGVRHLGQVV